MERSPRGRGTGGKGCSLLNHHVSVSGLNERALLLRNKSSQSDGGIMLFRAKNVNSLEDLLDEPESQVHRKCYLFHLIKMSLLFFSCICRLVI